MEIEADHLEQLQERGLVTAKGRVRVRSDANFLLETNDISYNVQTRAIDADGVVRMCRNGEWFYGSRLHLEGSDDRGSLDHARIAMSRSGGRATAEKVVLHDRNTLTLHGAKFTNCNCENPPWYLKSDRIQVNRQENEAKAENVTLFLHGLPLAYVPWWRHPLRNVRQSGFLTPTPRISSANGFEVDIPYYLNIAPDQDATLTLHPTTRRGTMGKVQYRYLGAGYRGEFETHGIYDTQLNEFRGLLAIDDQRRPDQDWLIKTRVEQTRSRHFINDFEQKLVENSHRHLDSFSLANRLWSRDRAYTGFETGVRWFQDLQTPNDRQTVQQLPFAKWVDDRPLVPLGPGWRMGSMVRLDNFYQLTGDLTNRVDLAPTLDYTRSLPMGRLRSQIGVRESLYQVSGDPLQAGGHGDGSSHREASLANVRLDSRLQRTYTRNEHADTLFAALKHVVEPSVQYTVNAVNGQSGVPNYDSQANVTHNNPVLREFSTSNLFATNLYPGIDRISGGHWLTYGVTNRLMGRQVDHGMIREVASLTVGQRWAPSGQRDYQREHPFSDLVTSLNLFLTDRWSMRMGSRFDPYGGTLVSANSELSYATLRKDQYGVGFNLNRPETAETIKDATLSANFGLLEMWRWSQKINYSLEQNSVKNWRSGLIYEHDCWSFEWIAGRRLASSTVDHGGSFAGFQINFKGLGGYGFN
ncbi:MAG: LPS-assembly protein LptD [Magnetococcales bacterium]|nr:LPS-assembly protein LptD [Magnetococcales bacterium]MBF0323108.1 LPS-assembly protein LptD [Magnetococcales bacterium]